MGSHRFEHAYSVPLVVPDDAASDILAAVKPRGNSGSGGREMRKEERPSGFSVSRVYPHFIPLPVDEGAFRVVDHLVQKEVASGAPLEEGRPGPGVPRAGHEREGNRQGRTRGDGLSWAQPGRYGVAFTTPCFDNR
jgi:hypothetical protein